MSSYAEKISTQLNIKPSQAASAIELLEGGNTIPFISRYRKEATGSLDEEQIRQIEIFLARFKALDERRAVILASIEEQGRMTDELRSALLQAETLTALEDLYQPYKPKRKTRASIAREKGLQLLAEKILHQEISDQTAESLATPFLNENVLTVEDALAGALDIVAETISEHADVRRITRERAMQWGILRSEKLADAQDERRVYQVYYQFEGRVDRLRPHQILAVNRGEAEKILRVQVEIPERDWRTAITSFFRPDRRSPFADPLKGAMEDAAERLLLPAIERDVRRTLTESAEMHAVTVFASNLRALISQPPLAGHTVLGLDPGFRTGCKAAVVDSTGRLLDTFTIYPHEPQKRKQEALETLKAVVNKYGVTLVAIGNGTASRETEQLVADLIHVLPDLRYLIVSEAGASVYSASPLARAELPDLDVSLRGAVSIGRRIQDPLAELVKIDPKSIGVGLYQHDVNQNELNRALNGVIESVVNNVGVEVNTASPALLTHVAGIGPKLAERIVAYREDNGPFKNRFDLLKVNGLGPKVFEQAAGFLRIRGGEQSFDASAIHPESYPVAQAILQKAGISIQSSIEEKRMALGLLQKQAPIEKLAAEFGTGEPTLRDIFEQIIRPGRDPRENTPLPILRSDVLSMEDLQPGMQLKGTVRNVVDFGVFVDIGVKQDGLLHRSQIPSGSILQVGDVIEVEVLTVEVDRGRISLSWISTA